MKLSPITIYKPSFKAHFYKIMPGFDAEISTDNEHNLGSEPYLVYKYENQDQEKQMELNNGVFIAKAFIPAAQQILSYHIKYKDTDKTDKKAGENYSFNLEDLEIDAVKRIKLKHNQPLIRAYKNGTAVGKIQYIPYAGNADEIKEPTILVTKYLGFANLDNPNIVGVIFTSQSCGFLSHFGATLRSQTNASASVFDPEIIKKLKVLDGKNVKLNVSNNRVEIEETNEPVKPKTYPAIQVPEMIYCNKILTSKEYEQDLVGAKAYNLKKLEKLAETGKIGAIIPDSIALPYGYIEQFTDKTQSHKYTHGWKEYNDTIESKMQELSEVLKSNNINQKLIYVRSAFNGEDLPNYSAAGIYSSRAIFNNGSKALYDAITNLADSKYNYSAIQSRKNYKIDDSAIKPCLIMQNCIKPDYKFTVYTDCDNNKLKIDLYSDRIWGYGEYSEQPHIFTYDKKTKKLSYDSIQEYAPYVKYDENLNPIEIRPIKTDLTDNKQVWDLVQRLVYNALVIEKEFGAPQDIEGGFKDNDIYLWQTRNIV